MRIGIIGSGNMGSALGKLWAQQGHQVMFSYSRDRAKLEAIAADVGANAQVGSPSEAAEFGEVILFVVPRLTPQRFLSIGCKSVGSGKSIPSHVVGACPVNRTRYAM
jgi:predicted dinucleotide-binding enzyme